MKMACVICGKAQRIIPVNLVKYSTTHNSLAEVLTSVLGSKIKDVDWSSPDNQICYPCNRHCEQYDKLDSQLQDIKEHILREYARHLYRSEQKQMYGPAPFKKIKLDAEADRTENEKEGNESEEVQEEVDRASPITILSNDEMEPAFFGQHIPLKEEADDNYVIPKECSVMVDRLPDSITERFADQKEDKVMRVVDRCKITRLPDYDFEEWYELDGYCFILCMSTSRGKLLKCHKRGCPVCIRITQSAITRVTAQHRHEPDTKIAERNHLYAQLKMRAAKEPETPLLTIYNEEAARYPGGASYLPYSEEQMLEWRGVDDTVIVVVGDDENTKEKTPKHRCDVCNINFPTSKELTCHVREHDKKSRRCNICRRLFTDREQLIRHEVTHRVHEMKNDEKIIQRKKTIGKQLDQKLTPVKKTLNDSTLKAVDEETSTLCWLCSVELPDSDTLKKHMASRHKEVNLCHHCEVTFNSKKLLEEHNDEFHTSPEERKKKAAKKKPDETETAHEDNSSNDEETVADDPVDVDLEETVEAPQVHTREASLATKGERCELFPCLLSRKSGLKRHMALAHPTGQFKCRHCGELYSNKFSLVSHEMRCALETSGGSGSVGSRAKFKCQVCGRAHVSEERLTDHMYTHCQRKKFECSECGYSHHQRSTITNHMSKEGHMGTVMVNPPILDLELLGPREPKLVQRRHAPDHGQLKNMRRYECSVCGSQHITTQSLYTHMKQQGHLSDSVVILEAEQETDNGKEDDNIKEDYLQKPIVIDGMKIKYKSEAMLSWYRLSGKKPFECAVCGAGFMTKVQLFRHMEKMDHISDSIVENVPVLEDVQSFNEVPTESRSIVREKTGDRRPKREIEGIDETTGEVIYAPREGTKPESKHIEILSQVIIQPESHQTVGHEENADGNQLSTYVTESEAGETILVLQGDIARSLNEDSQLFMDEEGNIVAQDQDGNTVQVMQVDVVQAQRSQQQMQVLVEHKLEIVTDTLEIGEKGRGEENSELDEQNSEICHENTGISEKNTGISEENAGIDEENPGIDEENPGIDEENTESDEKNTGIDEKDSRIGENSGMDEKEFDIAGIHEDNKEIEENLSGVSMPSLDPEINAVTKDD